MRSKSVMLVALAAAAALVGCKNQSTGAYTNPFLTPDRVPPPSTRVLAPGTAQPYYPGDPVPGAVPGVATPGAPMYAPAPIYTPPPAGSQPPLTTPPGGWGYGPQSSLTPTGGGFDASWPGSGTASWPGSGTPSFPGSGTTRLAEREVTAAEFYGSRAATPQLASAEVTRDGFRPQGSAPRTDVEPDRSFRPPAIARDSSGAVDDASQYAAGTNFESLRGQLEYWPDSGAWSLRYLPAGAAADSFGGRVMIDNPQVLANLQPGELVTVRGQLFSQANEAGAATPTYRVSGVQRQRY